MSPELAQVSAQLDEPVADTDHEVVGGGCAVRAGGVDGDVAFQPGQDPDVPAGLGVRWTRVLVLGISPAEAFGYLCPERIAAHLGVAVQCLLSGVVRCHPQAGRPCNLLLHGREYAPTNVLVSHQERLGAFDWRQRGRPSTGERPT